MPVLRGYYAILDVPAGQGSDTRLALSRTERLLLGAPCIFQIRAKGSSAAALAALVRAVAPVVRSAGVPLCVNDRLDVALAVGANVVHLGQDDLPLAEARRVAAGRLSIGISTHNAAQAAAAVAGGADYVGLGPIFATATKANPDPVVGLDALSRVALAAPIPVVAIGGIGLHRVADVAATGAAAAALIGALERADDPAAAGRAVNAAFGV